MGTRSWVVGLCAAVLWWGANPGAAGRAGEGKAVRVLLVLGSPPFHDIRKLPPILEKVLARVGGFKVTRLEPPADRPPNDPEHMKKLAAVKRADYDVLVFYTTGYKLDEPTERALEQFVEAGGGVVALHGASASFGNSTVWTRLIGGRFTGHLPGTHKLPVVPTEVKHPITAGVGPFEVVDEEYTHKLADVPREVLLRFKERPKGSKGTNHDVLWTRQIGKGRVVYNALGHGREAWENPAWQRLAVQSILWAAGRPREVSLRGTGAK
ncbi:MAG: ThuA domain-containing protein [Gemmataceae bacterium]|nr:ThuA domain-containing protein [Gemmataceae bacterium]